ncbi:hypothetical protein [Hyphomonas chukchiensis]|uniref:Uncharacterized protein n=1 Tax=Hyphomonas chukchiensis TaxID=1280947 RepID=A0A062UHB7_9PROT|nr:hypothetical protein [Hyphomonas chukchiensis]KCZ57672.1 hypothetical protein HY30_05695 [Hyphomonas chukchiensis]
MKAILFAVAGIALLAPTATARDSLILSAPFEQVGYVPQSGAAPARELQGGPGQSGAHVSSQARIIRVTPREQKSGIRIFRGSVVTEHGRSPTWSLDTEYAGKTVIRVKKPPRNPYKTVIVYTPGSVTRIRPDRFPD